MKRNSPAVYVAFTIACLSWPAAAQFLSADDLKAKNPTQLEKADVESLVKGSTTESTGRSGGQRTWQNMDGGRLIGRSYGAGARASGTAGEGKWRIADDGKYCVEIAWTGVTFAGEEKWCGPVVKAGSDHYVVFASGNAMKVLFKK
jgi:hypothetical protein